MLKGSDSPFCIRRNEHDLTTIQISPKRVHRFTQKHHKTPKNT
jgi:hypothetical protein